MPTESDRERHRRDHDEQQRQEPGGLRGDIRKRLSRLEKDAGNPRECAHPRRRRFGGLHSFGGHNRLIVLSLFAKRSAMMAFLCRFALRPRSAADRFCSRGARPTPESHSKAFLGAVLIDGAGGPPLSNSIVMTADDRIRAVGPRSSIPIPAEADKIDGSGKCIVPTPVDACDRAEPAGAIHAATPEEARRQMDGLRRPESPRRLSGESPRRRSARQLLEAARGGGYPGVAADFNARGGPVPGGPRRVGLHWNDRRHGRSRRRHFWRIFATCGSAFAPALVSAGAGVEMAKRNTRRLFQAGVPIAAATRGGDLQREIELLVEAGLPPLDAIVAATRNPRDLLRISDRGTIAPRKAGGSAGALGESRRGRPQYAESRAAVESGRVGQVNPTCRSRPHRPGLDLQPVDAMAEFEGTAHRGVGVGRRAEVLDQEVERSAVDRYARNLDLLDIDRGLPVAERIRAVTLTGRSPSSSLDISHPGRIAPARAALCRSR